MKNIEVTILKSLCKAELSNIAAHKYSKAIHDCDYFDNNCYELKKNKDFCYKIKQNNIEKAIRLLKSCKCYNIKYKIERNVPDQNGNTSTIYYFEIKIENEWKQISFHSFNKKREEVHNGHKEILWNGDVNGSIVNVELIIKKFHFHLD